MRTRRELILLLSALSSLLLAAPADMALAKGGTKKDGDAKSKTDKPKEPKLDEKFKAALKDAKKHLGRGKDGVSDLLAGLDKKDKVELNLNSKESTNYSKKQADSKLRDWLKANTLTIGKRKSVQDGKSVSWDVEFRNPQKREGTLRLTFVKDGKSYRLRGIAIRAK